MNPFAVFLLIACSCLRASSANRTSFYAREVVSLSEFPMSELIQIKSSLEGEQDNVEVDEESEEMSGKSYPLSLPVALPLKRASKKPIRRYEEHYDEKGKDSKISKIFQLSVTALSFLAFGGYLLTLIITSIRQNTTAQGTGNVIVLSNLQALQNYNRPKRSAPIIDPAGHDFDIEKLYRGMICLSKSYATYN